MAMVSKGKGESVSTEALERAEVLLDSLERKLEYINDKIRFDQISSHSGKSIGHDLILEVSAVAISILFTLFEKLQRMDM
mmetsp:Transcript_13198/g.20570  ORF Transcript_13198/g.20570 Transcript_13198/m.20570 type:complete len:80 (-) Transcript_13198:30-269(-)